MRFSVVVLIGALVIADPSVCRGQEKSGVVRSIGSPTTTTEVKSPSATTSSSDDPLQLKRLVDRLQPIQEKVAKDDRLRMVSGIVGLGVLAYEAHPQSPQVPLGFIGAEALRVSLRPQLKMLKSKTGFDMEPSIGRRRFEVTFRKTLD